jgi:glutamyl-tRNA reductase
MPILVLGVSYRRASVELLERLAFVEEDYAKAYRRLKELPSVREAVVLSTCNRTEVYAEVATYHAGFLDLKRFIAESRELTPEEFAEPLYSHYEDDAAGHLFRVASGLDSMVLGEQQILGQVRDAYRLAHAEGTTGSMLSSLFRDAVRTGKRVRAQTLIGASPTAFLETGARLAVEVLGGLAGRAVAVVGAGGMAAMAARYLRTQGVGDIRILNRSPERARRLAEQAGGEAHGLDMLASAVGHADLVVSSTGAAGLVIGADTVRRAMVENGRAGRPLFLLDLAVPRDIDPEAASIPGVSVADLDDLKDALEPSAPGSAFEVERARDIIDQEVKRFAAWRRAARLAPLIHALRARGEAIQAAELVRMAPRLADLTDREREAVEALARGIVAKLLHHPIVRLKETAGPGSGDAIARTVADIFGIEYRPGG